MFIKILPVLRRREFLCLQCGHQTSEKYPDDDLDFPNLLCLLKPIHANMSIKRHVLRWWRSRANFEKVTAVFFFGHFCLNPCFESQPVSVNLKFAQHLKVLNFKTRTCPALATIGAISSFPLFAAAKSVKSYTFPKNET